MANMHRGEAAVSIGGRDYRFVFTIHAICEVESAENLPIGMVMQKLQRGYVSTICILVWGGLREHHPEMTLKAARELTVALVEDVGAEEAGRIIGEAVSAAFPQPKAEVDSGKKTEAGSGTSS